MVIEAMRNIIYTAGPSVYVLVQALPFGLQQFECVLATSGHMVISRAEFPQAHDSTGRDRWQLTHRLTLLDEIAPEVTLTHDARGSSVSTRSVVF